MHQRAVFKLQPRMIRSMLAPLAGTIQCIPTPLAGTIRSIPAPLAGMIQCIPTPLAGTIQCIPTPLAATIRSIPAPLAGADYEHILFIRTGMREIRNIIHALLVEIHRSEIDPFDYLWTLVL